MKLARLERCAPVGLDCLQEIRWMIWCLVPGLLYSLGFLSRLSGGYNALFQWQGQTKVLIEGAVMPDFLTLLDGSFLLFGAAALCALGLGVWHYLYHHQGAKSIYLMRRLPDSRELFRRCAALPALALLFYLVVALLLTAVYLGLYVLVTPAVCRPPLF